MRTWHRLRFKAAVRIHLCSLNTCRLMQSQSTVLMIGVAAAPQASSVLDVYTATTAREALATIRLVSLDLMVVGLDDSSLDVWTLMQRVVDAWPHLRWILAASDL